MERKLLGEEAISHLFLCEAQVRGEEEERMIQEAIRIGEGPAEDKLLIIDRLG